jgi:hypothetical protein
MNPIAAPTPIYTGMYGSAFFFCGNKLKSTIKKIHNNANTKY